MTESSKFAVVLSTMPSNETAIVMARHVVEEGLAACVNIVPGVVSIYEWNGKVEESGESLLIMKAPTESVPMLIERVAQMHPYECPEIISLPVESGLQRYLDWIDSAAHSSRRKEGGS